MIISYIRKLMSKFKGNQRSMLSEIMTDNQAVFSSFGNDIYMSDFVNNCIDRIATEISKIEVMSVVESETMSTGRMMILAGCSAISQTLCRHQRTSWHAVSGSGASI